MSDAPQQNQQRVKTTVSSQVSTSKRSSKKKNADADDMNIKFLKNELSAAQARITQLDSSLSDKDKYISVLQAKINTLEEKVNNANYEKYFPNEG